MEDLKPGWVDKKITFAEARIKELESQLSCLRYATNAEISYELSKYHQEYQDPNKSILGDLESVRFTGGHGYVTASYILKNGAEGYVSDTTFAIYLIDYATEKGIYER